MYIGFWPEFQPENVTSAQQKTYDHLIHMIHNANI